MISSLNYVKNRHMGNQKGNVILLVLLTIVAIVSLSTAIFVFVKQREVTNTPEATAVPTVTPFTFTPPSQTPVAVSATSSATVKIEKENELSTAIKTSITARIVNPFLAYYKDQSGADYVKSLTISVNTGKTAAEFPYKAEYVFDKNVTGGFLITVTGTSVNWWTPECLNGCNFSDSFKSKYPEIVAATK